MQKHAAVVLSLGAAVHTPAHAQQAPAKDYPSRRAFGDQGFVPVGSTPDEFSKAIADELEFNRRLVAKIGLIPE